MCALPTYRARDKLALSEFALTVERAQNRATGKDDQHLLVCVMNMQREAR
jgi:hypothetical protein